MQIITAYLIAAALGTLWLGLTAHALFSDRSRGRPRCPRCFFDLSGSAQPARCAECGRAITPQSRLHKTHRRWGRAVLAGLILLGPAAGAGALGRVMQTGGWADLPGWVLSRIAWLDQPKLLEELGRRLLRGELSIADGTRVMNHAARLLKDRRPERVETGLTLIERAGWQSYLNRTGPTLAALDSGRLAGPLFELAEVAAYNARSIQALDRLRENDPRISIKLFVMQFGGDAAINAQSQSASFTPLLSRWRPATPDRMSPQMPTLLKNAVRQVAQNGKDILSEASVLAAEMEPFANDLPAMHRWARELIQTPRPDVSGLEPKPGVEWEHMGIDPKYADAQMKRDAKNILRAITGQFQLYHPLLDRARVRRHVGLWLCALIDPNDPDFLTTIERLIAEGDMEDHDNIAETVLIAPRWSAAVQGMHTKLLKMNTFAAAGVIHSANARGLVASGLQDDILEWARRVDRKGGTSALAEAWLAIGGDPKSLATAIVDRLNELHPVRESRVWKTHSQGGHSSFSFPRGTFSETYWSANINDDFKYLSDLGVKDSFVLDSIARWTDFGFDSPGSDALQAYVILGGDSAWATRALLGKRPIFSDPLYSGSAQQVIFELIRRGLADAGLISSEVLAGSDAQQAAGLLSNMVAFKFTKPQLEPYRSALERLATSDKPELAGPARELLATIQQP